MSELKRGLFGDAESNRSEPSDAALASSGDVHPVESLHDDSAFESAADAPILAPDSELADENVAAPNSRPAKAKRFRRIKQKGKRRRLSLAVLPTMLTLGNGVCGLGAIAIATSTILDWPPEQKLFVAGALIFGGMLFDALDGSAARMTGQSSQFGAELDSLCDTITFGVAPAVIVWRISDLLPQRLTWAIGVLFALCVVIRLARFNVETKEDDDHEGFDGLPSPAAAGTIAAFAIAMPDLAAAAAEEKYPAFFRQVAEQSLHASHFVIPVLALVLAFLMVSRFQYPHVVQQWVRGRRAPHQIGQALFLLASIFILHWLALPVAFCYFAFASPVRSWIASYREAKSVPDTL